MKRRINIALQIFVFALIAAGIYYFSTPKTPVVLRPDGSSKEINPKSLFAPEKSEERLKEFLPPQEAVAAPAEVKPPEEAIVSPEEMEKRVAEHGLNAVLKVKEKLRKGEPTELPLVEPNWNNPFFMDFNVLLLLYRYYSNHGYFSQKSVEGLNGAAVILQGALMPIEPPPESGIMKRFWVANPRIVMAGCVFCNPPTLGDIVYVDASKNPIKVNREELYKNVVIIRAAGRFFLGPRQTEGEEEHLYSLELFSLIE